MDLTSLNYKLNRLKLDLKKRGLIFVLKKGFVFLTQVLLRPFINLSYTNKFVRELSYGFFPNLKQRIFSFSFNSNLLKMPRSELVEKVREFWYSNIPGVFDLDYNPPTTSFRKRAPGEKISRKNIFTYGGPNPAFSCPICQKSEWLSRVRQKNLFISHFCFTSERCKILCSRQEDESWTHFHQNFDFSIGYNPNLPAAKALRINFKKKEDFLRNINQRIEPIVRVLSRQFAYSCQLDMAEKPIGINWNKYDFGFINIEDCNQKFPRPDIPVILFGHDFWHKPKNFYQWIFDWLQPDILLTTYPTQWKENFKLPSQTKVVFHPMFPSLFFTRSNLNQKILDLLAIGSIVGPVYKPRRLLNEQISQLVKRYKIEFSYRTGDSMKNIEENQNKGNFRFFNKWSEYLGSAKYVIFGRMKYPILLGKYYECLGSGAIPIFPEVPDLKLLGIKPFEHYIPLSEVEGNNKKLAYFLDHYQDFKYIAENAVNWYKENSDKMLFNNFEDLIREITNHRFPKRLI